MYTYYFFLLHLLNAFRLFLIFLINRASKQGHKEAAQHLARLENAIKNNGKPPSTLTSVDKISTVQAEDLVQKENTCISCSKKLMVDSAQW